MKKVLLCAYLNENLGDDLFVNIILNRYKDSFYIYNRKNYKAIEEHKNIFFSGNKITNYIDKTLRNFCNTYMLTKEKGKYDILLYVGGSLFAENKSLDCWKERIKQYSINYIPYYILGSNVGPYKHEEFLEILREGIFKNATDVCFRDTYSYNLFKDLKNVRKASDIIFSWSEIKK